MSLMNLLYSRLDHDPAVEFFLQDVFLHMTSNLKSCRLVSNEWNDFIKSKVWNTKRTRKYLDIKLSKSWASGEPVNKVVITKNLTWIEKFPYIKRITCDDDILLLSGENSQVKRVHVFDLVKLQQTASLELEQDNSSDNEVRFSIGPNYFSTILTYEKWLKVWTKSGSLMDKIVIDDAPRYLRVIKAVNSMIFIIDCDRSSDDKVFLFKLDDKRLVKLNFVKIGIELGTTRTIESDRNNLFFTGHDQTVQVWEVGKEKPLRYFSTGLVVDMVLKKNTLLTVGSHQNPGVNFWNITSGTKLITVLLENGGFEQITLGVNQILLKGLKYVFLAADFDDFAQKNIEHVVFCHDDNQLIAMSKTKFVSYVDYVSYSLPGSISVSDFWNKL